MLGLVYLLQELLYDCDPRFNSCFAFLDKFWDTANDVSAIFALHVVPI